MVGIPCAAMAMSAAEGSEPWPLCDTLSSQGVTKRYKATLVTCPGRDSQHTSLLAPLDHGGARRPVSRMFAP